jgi:hypothetical protein
VSKSCTLGATPSALSRGHFGPVFSFLMWRNHRSVFRAAPHQKSQLLFNVEEPQISRAAPSLRLGCFFSSSSFSPPSPRCTSSILGVLLSVSVRFGSGRSVRFRSVGRSVCNNPFLYLLSINRKKLDPKIGVGGRASRAMPDLRFRGLSRSFFL